MRRRPDRLPGRSAERAVRESRRSILTSYLPDILVRALCTRDIPRPCLQMAAVVFADFSGYSRFAADLEARGKKSEDLVGHLNRGFRIVVNSILEGGGDIVRFAGDAALAIWPAASNGLDAAVARAAGCGREMIRRLDRSSFFADTGISLRVGVSGGGIWLLCPGGRFGRREFMVIGRPLRAAAAALQSARPGELAIDPAGSRAGAQSGGGRRVAANLTRRPPDGRLMRFVPAPIAHRVSAGLARWTSESRVVTILFAHIEGWLDDRPDPPAAAQRLLLLLQDAVYQHEGSLNQFLEDDKGLTLLAAFGLPPLAHTDDPIRALSAARDILQRVPDLGHRVSIGIAGGPVFCGDRGTPRRRDYAMVGHTVNLAARLMQAADGGILCDASTADRSRGAFRIRRLNPIRIKGMSRPVSVYRPLKPAAPPENRDPLLGRQTFLRTWNARLHTLKTTRTAVADVWILEGEPGIGKSRLLEAFANLAHERGVRSLLARGEGWLEPGRTWDRIRAQAGLEPLQFPPGSEKDGATRDRMLADDMDRFRRIVRERPTAVLIDDADRLDSASAWWISNLAQRAGTLLLVLTRPPRGASHPSDALILPHARIARIPGLSLAATRRLLQPAGGRDVTLTKWVRRIHEASRGNPYLIREYARREDPAAEPRDPADANISRWIAQRVDRLDPTLAILLKISAVLDAHIDPVRLASLAPAPTRKGGLESRLAELAALGFLDPHSTAEGPRLYRFAGDTLRAGIATLVPDRDRRRLHRAAARLGARDDTVAGLLAHARHWKEGIDRACRPADRLRAARCMATAAEHWLSRFGDVEAAALLEAAGGLRLRAGAVELARWDHLRAQALLNLCRIEESLDAAGSALRRLGIEFDAPPARAAAIARRGGRHPGEAARTLNLLGQITFYLHRPRDNFRAYASAWRAATRANDTEESIRAAAGLCVSAETAGRRSTAEAFADRAQAALRKVRDPGLILWVRMILAVYAAGRRQPSRATAEATRALDLARALGDGRREMQCLNTRATIAWMADRNGHAERDWRRLTRRADSLADGQYRRIGRSGLIQARLRQGDTRGAAVLAKEIQSLPSTPDPGVTARIHAESALALVAIRRRDSAAARRHLLRALAAATDTGLMSYTDRMVLHALEDVAHRLGRKLSSAIIVHLQEMRKRIESRFGRDWPGRREGVQDRKSRKATIADPRKSSARYENQARRSR